MPNGFVPDKQVSRLGYQKYLAIKPDKNIRPKSKAKE